MSSDLQLTKFGHSAFGVTKNGASVIVDPGSLTDTIRFDGRISAIVITHDHPDHWTQEWIDRLTTADPVPIFTTPDVAEKISASHIRTVTENGKWDVDGFTLEFTPTTHARVHNSIPAITNLTCFIDRTVMYTGDSLDRLAAAHPPVLAVPIGAPWMKLGEAIDFVLAAQPERCFPVHDGVLSQAGRALATGRISWAAEQHPGGVLLDLSDGESVPV